MFADVIAQQLDFLSILGWELGCPPGLCKPSVGNPFAPATSYTDDFNQLHSQEKRGNVWAGR